MHPALVSGIVSTDSPVSYWPIFLALSQITDPEVFAKVNSAQFSSRFSMPYATCTSPIMHLIFSPKLCITRSPWAPGQKSWHNLCFSFLLGITAVPREIKTMLMQNFAGQIRCIMGYVQVPYLQLAEIQFKKCTSFHYVCLLVQSSFIHLPIRKDVWS